MLVALTNALAKEFNDLDDGEALELDGFSYTLCETTNEINESKYVTWDKIFKRSDGKYFRQNSSKSGSYFSDYEFYYGNYLAEVVQVEVIRKTWKVVD